MQPYLIFSESIELNKEFTKLQNFDRLSCYSNSLIQIIFNCSTIEEKLKNDNTSHILKKVFFEYKNKTLKNLHELREFVHEQYKYYTIETKTDYNQQQDVAEFLSIYILNQIYYKL